MRKAVMILIALICVGAAVNRNAFKSDISNRDVVQGVGIDINEDGTYTVTLETINTENYSNADGAAKPVMNLRTLKGKTVSTAIKSAYSIDGKTPVLSQNRVIVIGKELAGKGILPSLDFFIRDAENYPTVQIAVVEGKASDFFKNASSESTVVSRNMPIIETFKEKDRPEIKSKGTAVFKEGKYVCNLNEEETSALNFLCNNARKGSVDFNTDEDSAAISIIRCKTVQKVDYSAENPNFYIKIKIDADISEADSSTGYSLSESEVDALKGYAEEKIKNDIEKLTRKLYSEEKADVAGLSRLIYIHYPELFRKNEKNLSEIMTESQYFAEVEICVRRIGQDYVS